MTLKTTCFVTQVLNAEFHVTWAYNYLQLLWAHQVHLFFSNTWWGSDTCFLSRVFVLYEQFYQWSVISVWLAALQLGIIVSWVLILCFSSPSVFHTEMDDLWYLLSHSFPFLFFLSLWLSFFGAVFITCITMISMTLLTLMHFHLL